MMNFRLLLVVILFGTTTAFAKDFTSERVMYTSINDTQAKVTGLESTFNGALVIPDKVDGYSITSISSGAFLNNKQMTSVIIPHSVTSIGTNAFYGCSVLYKAEIKASVTTIANYLFYGCTNLSSVILPSTVIIIGESAFENCCSLQTLSFPQNLTGFGTHAFKNAGLTAVIFPSRVSSLGTWSFEACKNLKYIKLPTSLTAIDEGTFYNCTALEYVTIPANIKIWGNNAFNNCRSLRNVYYLGTSKPTISQYTFLNCSPSFQIYVKSSGYYAIKSMNYYGSYVKKEIPLKLTADTMAFSADYDVNFTDANGLTAFVVKSYDDAKGRVAMTAVTKVKAGTGLILKGKAGSTYTLSICATEPEAQDNLLLAALMPQITEAKQMPEPSKEFPNTMYKGNLLLSLDKSVYAPGEDVTLSFIGEQPAGLKVQYMKGVQVIETVEVSSNPWTWKPPLNDFTGYMAVVYTQDNNNQKTIYGTIGIDVSSDWTRFPRYGFIADYGLSKNSFVVRNETKKLASYHMNAIQFYDWHNKHHWPLGGTRESLLTSYKDIANRTVYNSVIKDYISNLHGIGAACMMYNLCYGILDDAQKDGVDLSWGAYTDASHTNLDYHKLSSSWKSNIYLVNPANVDWQHYLAQRNDDVYNNLNFDGFHIDQLGSRSTLYTFGGSSIDLPSGFNSFVKAMKKAHPQKKYAFNAVSCYGGNEIITSESVDFAYDELWGGQANFSDLHDVIENNYDVSGHRLNTVIAGYMDYNKSNTVGFFNTAGVLLTDATIFALGGAHLELSGDHMLCTEYFPNANCQMDAMLSTNITHYYDFLTAYENLLRDGGQEIPTDVYGTGALFNNWPPQLGSVASFSRQFQNKRVIHLLNYSKANSLSWRDMDGTQPEPKELNGLSLTLQIGRPIVRLWTASPDYQGGVPIELNFTQTGSEVKFTLPCLKYWTMIVAEYADEEVSINNNLDYSLFSGQFCNIADSHISSEQAYLQIPSISVRDSSLPITLDFGITDIKKVKSHVLIKNTCLYDLQGRKERSYMGGIYIQNGQKIFKK